MSFLFLMGSVLIIKLAARTFKSRVIWVLGSSDADLTLVLVQI